MDIIATQLEEGMEIKGRNGYPVIIEDVLNDERKPYVEFFALDGMRFRVPNEEPFVVLS